MEVKGIGQGGQDTLDYYMNKAQDSGMRNTEVSVPRISSKDDNSEDIDEIKVKNAVDKINKLLEDKSTHVVYESHDLFKHDIIIKIVENETNEVIKEVPPRKLLDMVAKLCEIAGIFINQKA